MLMGLRRCVEHTGGKMLRLEILGKNHRCGEGGS